MDYIYTTLNTINVIFEQAVLEQKDHKRNEGIYICIEVDSRFLGFDNYDQHHPEWEGYSCNYLHILMIYPCSVYTATSTVKEDINNLKWKNTTNHSSCWTSGCSELIDIVFNVHDTAHANIPDKHECKPRKRTDNVSIRFATGYSKLFKFVKVETKQNDLNPYHSDIVVVREIKKIIIC